MTQVLNEIPAEVRSVYEAYQGSQRKALFVLRAMILEVGGETEGVGEIEECLKWGQPSFVTKRPKSGSTIRIDAVKECTSKVAAYFICNTNLVERFREHYSDTFAFEGNRALILDGSKPMPVEPLRHCFAMALTYHLKK